MKNFCKNKSHKFRNNGKSYIKITNKKKSVENPNKIFKMKSLEEKFFIKNIFNYSNINKTKIKKINKKKLVCKHTLKKIDVIKTNNIYFNSNTNKNIFKFSFFKKVN